MNFPTDKESIEKRIQSIDVIKYSKNRNFINGSVTHLSPYITHGYITLTFLRDRVLQKFSKKDAYTFIFELAWREFFQRTWEKEGDRIFTSLRHEQEEVLNHKGLPKVYLSKKTQIQAIDNALKDLEDFGYVHNHARMWIAMLLTNVYKNSWYEGANHMYYYLLDGDRASNTLSWQWVAGTFSSKRYVANQDMINKYSDIQQHNTYIDIPVEDLLNQPTPKELLGNQDYDLTIDDTLLNNNSISVSDILKKETWLYSMWTLDANWTPTEQIDVQKILMIDKADLLLFPMSSKRISFILDLAKNIEDIKIFYGNISDLNNALLSTAVYRKSHPAIKKWIGKETDHEYMFPQVQNIPGGFMSFWKKCEPYL